MPGSTITANSSSQSNATLASRLAAWEFGHANVAEVRSDDDAYHVRFDAEPWFRQAGDHRILSLASAGWGNNYMADAVVEYFDGKEDYEGVNKLFEYVSAHPTMVASIH